MTETPPNETDAGAPLLRVLLAIAALAFFRWSLFRPVATETTAEAMAQNERRLLIERSQAALRQNRYEDALPPLERLTELQPKNHVYWWERTSVCRALHRPRDAAFALEQFVKTAPVPGEACPQLGFLYRELGEKEASLDAFRRCAALNPSDLQDAFYLGHAYELDNRVDEALAVYRGALRLGFNADDEAGVGRMLLRKGELQAAYEAVAPTLARNPGNADALFVAGVARSRQGRYDEARALLSRGASHGDSADFEYALGLIAEIQDRREEAIARYDVALGLDPQNADARAHRARLASGER